MWKTTLTLTLKLQIIFNILGNGQPSFINCFGGDESGLSTETHTSAHSWGCTWWWTRFTAARIDEGCFPRDAAIYTQGGDEAPAYMCTDQHSPPNLAPRHLQNRSACVRLRTHGAGACVSTGANNKTSSPHRYMQLVHLPNHGSLKISAEWERALQRMICPRPHRKSVAKMEIEPIAPGSGAVALLRAQGHPGTCPREDSEVWVGWNHLACTYLRPVGPQDALAAGAQQDSRTSRRAHRGLSLAKMSSKILPCSRGFWFIFSPWACLFSSCCWHGEGYLIRAEGQMLSSAQRCLQEAWLLFRCEPSDSHKTANGECGGKK